jgi:hypothetical protein
MDLCVIGLLVWASPASAQARGPSKAAQTKHEGTQAPGTDAPTPADPYPLNAAGWDRRSAMACFSAIATDSLNQREGCCQPRVLLRLQRGQLGFVCGMCAAIRAGR